MTNSYSGQMECPHCHVHAKTQVVDSRRRRDGDPGIRRRRRCQECKETFSTFEVVVTLLGGGPRPTYKLEDNSSASIRLTKLQALVTKLQNILDQVDVEADG